MGRWHDEVLTMLPGMPTQQTHEHERAEQRVEQRAAVVVLKACFDPGAAHSPHPVG